MKKLMTVILGLAFVFGTVGMSFAQPGPETQKTEKKKKTSKKKKSEKKEDAKGA
jgi:hypothetical protein